MYLKYSIAWFGMMVLAIINGAIREIFYKPYVGELTAHQIATVVILIFFMSYFYMLISRWPIESSRQAWIIGAIWLFMTLAFEFGFGRFIAGNSWSRLLHDYNILAGRIWVLVPIFITVIPYVFFRLKQNRPQNRDIRN